MHEIPRIPGPHTRTQMHTGVTSVGDSGLTDCRDGPCHVPGIQEISLKE